MDLFLPIVLFIVFCVLFSICGWCCKKHREGTVYGYAGNNVTVSSQPAAAIVPPYPVDARHQHPQPVPPMPGFAPTGGYQTAPYPATTTPYPPAPGGGYPAPTPYPMSSTAAPYPTATPSYPPSNAPYPPASAAPYSAQPLPPSYMEAVGHPPAEPHPVSEGYTKQSPYNPHY